jgi:hypothetical protein
MAFVDLAFAVTNQANTEVLFSVSDDRTVDIDTAVIATSLVVPSYTVSTLPSVGPAGQVILVTNAPGGAVLAFSEGTNWRSVVDGNIIS